VRAGGESLVRGSGCVVVRHSRPGVGDWFFERGRGELVIWCCVVTNCVRGLFYRSAIDVLVVPFKSSFLPPTSIPYPFLPLLLLPLFLLLLFFLLV
jgi:hypothetical protein